MTRRTALFGDGVASWLQTSLPDLLPPFLLRQRWFGGKARPIRAVGVEDVLAREGDAPAVFVIAAVSYEDGADERYGLVLGFEDEPGGLPVIGPTGRPDLPAWVVEAASDPDRVADLLTGFAAGEDRPTQRGGLLRFLDASDVGRQAAALDPGAIVPLRSEQSNTSIRVGSSLVFKLFRRLAAGENPEVEMGRFLTKRTPFRATPILHGALAYVAPDGTMSTVGVLQEWVASSGDGWTYVTRRLQDAVQDASALGDLTRDMATLGRTTADFHAALASDADTPAFRPEEVGPQDVDAWRARFSEQVSRSIGMVDRHWRTWGGDLRRLGEACMGLAGRLSALSPGLEQSASDLKRMRIHGDYHLGQTLKTPEGFAIIDFEGEPTRSIDERRQKHSALRDLAGMLRSFDYAIETACRLDPEAAGRLRSSVDLRNPFLAGYLEPARHAGTTGVPRERRGLDHWLAVFELEKALYELEYEINNRPAWIDIPLRWIVAALEREPRA
jgi:maltose alpha-D-glucosyltransferase/alpha-amylase